MDKARDVRKGLVIVEEGTTKGLVPRTAHRC